MLDKVLVFDESGTILLANEVSRLFFNLKNHALYNHNIFRILPTDISKKLREDIEDKSYKREKSILGKKTEIHIERPNSDIEYYEITTSNNYTEEVDTYSMTFKDITKKEIHLTP